MSRIVDKEARRQAIDPGRSFIVQAPAGSGKTELLIQRYLTLLGRVDEPEQILAMTFTVKAAGEMRERIVSALKNAAATPEAPEQEHERTTWTLARQALLRDGEQGWRLLEHTSRLQVQTIDSFCAGLTRQIPLLSQVGGAPGIAENPQALYRETAHRVLAMLETGEPEAELIRTLLGHLDNSKSGFLSRLLQLLDKRDQWMIYFFYQGLSHLHERIEDASRKRQEEILSGLIAAMLIDTKNLLSPFEDRIARLAAYAAKNIGDDKHADMALFEDARALPPPDASHLGHWQALAQWFLTREGGFRKKPNKSQGFPSGPAGSLERTMKEEASHLQEALAGVAGLADNLAEVRAAPHPRLSDDEWNVLKATLLILPHMANTLRAVFSAKGVTDFSEISLSALTALGDSDDPTDLLLYLDHRIQHILVDEYQDTSYKQYELLKRLTSGWERGDGRTLFIVGDPMQSIYRFRDAEVGLFLETRQKSMNHIELEPLTLKTNFRSQENVVEWVNACFESLFPNHDNPETGAIAYSASGAFWEKEDLPGAVYHPLPPGTDKAERGRAEAEEAVGLIEELSARYPEASIALLVRARSHLGDIVPLLHARGIRFQAEDIDPLTSRPEIRDLLALMRALLNPGDRLAWLSVLRAPWCGLSLHDLYQIAWRDREAPVWDLLLEPEGWGSMSEDGRLRARNFIATMTPVMAGLSRARFRDVLEGCWVALGGPACANCGEDIEVFFDEVEKAAESGDPGQLENFHQVIDQIFASPQTGGGQPVQIMTLHKAKGLEFDFVLLPGLGKRTPSDGKRLVFWMPHGDDLLLAPIEEKGGDNSDVYDFLANMDKEKNRFEMIRLLYVATTRARRQIHLFGHLKDNQDEPQKNSLLGRLWPAIGEDWLARLARMDEPLPPPGTEDGAPSTAHRIRRLPADYAPPPLCEDIVMAQAPVIIDDDIGELRFDWAGFGARALGNVLHRAFRDIAEDGLQGWTPARVEDMRPRMRAALMAEGLPEWEADKRLAAAVSALNNTLADPKGRWLLASREGAQELALTTYKEGRYQNRAIDRTFVDEDGVRWIIDYKTGTHKGPDIDNFLSQEKERYRKQLDGYEQLLIDLGETGPIKKALYYPLLAERHRLVEL